MELSTLPPTDPSGLVEAAAGWVTPLNKNFFPGMEIQTLYIIAFASINIDILIDFASNLSCMLLYVFVCDVRYNL